MLYQTVTEGDFIRAFDDVGRSDSFSVQARRVLFEWYDDLSYDMPGGIEFDPIGICCEWSEYSEAELIEQFDHLLDAADLDDGEDYTEALLEYLRDNGCLLKVEHIGEPDTYLFSE